LIGDAPISTKSLAPKGTEGTPPAPILSAVESAASDVFREGMMLRLEVTGAEPVLLKPKQELIFGRRDPATGAMPDVDLTPFAGYRMGVSRRHSAIRRNTEANKIELWDLGSSNGTFLNGTRLPAHQPHKLRDGDEIRLGQMVMKIYFQPADSLVEQPPSPPAAEKETREHPKMGDAPPAAASAVPSPVVTMPPTPAAPAPAPASAPASPTAPDKDQTKPENLPGTGTLNSPGSKAPENLPGTGALNSPGGKVG
jgi:predicted component of type VI protein secretion system